MEKQMEKQFDKTSVYKGDALGISGDAIGWTKGIEKDNGFYDPWA